MGTTVTFYSGYGEFSSGTKVNEILYSKSGAILSGSYQIPVYSDDYYSFGEWYSDKYYTNRVDVSADGIISSVPDTDITLYAKAKNQPRLAVQIYGIEHDVDSRGNKLGITFGGAIGGDFRKSYKSHTPDGNTGNGNQHRCLHNDTWQDICYWNDIDPYVYEQCVKNMCTHALPLYLDNSSLSRCDSLDRDFAFITGDGPGSFCVGNSGFIRQVPYCYFNPNDTYDNYAKPGNWSTMYLRAVLNGSDEHTYHGSGSQVSAEDSVYEALPDIIKSNIGTKCIEYWDSDKEESYIVNDNLWLLSLVEMLSTRSGSSVPPVDFGSTYEAFEKGNIQGVADIANYYKDMGAHSRSIYRHNIYSYQNNSSYGVYSYIYTNNASDTQTSATGYLIGFCLK